MSYKLALLYERIMFEASYDGMINSMKATYPDNATEINDNVKWAKATLKKDDRIVWFLKIYRASIAGDDQLQKLTGNYRFTDINKFKDDFGHFFGYQDQKIQNYQFKNQTISDAIAELEELEEKHLEDLKQNEPVTPQKGDYELIKFKDGTAWWFVDRAYCQDEGRSGKHCGNVNGQDHTRQRILSYRKDGHVQMSFILEPNGYLGEMKAKSNNKPSEKMHPYIMSLLLNPIVKGIKGGGYKPDANFSIFDLDEKNLKVIDEQKPELIKTELSIDPIRLINTTEYIRNNEEYQNIAIKKMPALQHIIKDGNWDLAIKKDLKLILYAPETIDNWEDRVLNYLKNHTISNIPKRITDNQNLMNEYLKINVQALQYIKNQTPELCISAVSRDGGALQYVKNQTEDICLAAVKESGYALFYVKDQTDKICLAAVSRDASALEYVKDQTPEICLAAVNQYGSALKFVKNQTEEMCLASVKQDGYWLEYVKDQTEDICLAAVKENGYALRLVKDQTPDICLAAVKRSPDVLPYVKDPELKHKLELHLAKETK